jgi:hypothetical protein
VVIGFVAAESAANAGFSSTDEPRFFNTSNITPVAVEGIIIVAGFSATK